MWRCGFLGHDIEFRTRGRTLTWECSRGCGHAGSKQYTDATAATRYARALNRRDNADVGRRAPLIGLLPLRLWHRFRAGSDPGRP